MDNQIITISLKIDAELLKLIDEVAKEDERNRSEQIRFMLKKYLEIRGK